MARVSEAGVVTAVAAGSAILTARIAGVRGSVALTVTAPTLDSFTLAPTALTLPLGRTGAIVAMGRYSNGTTRDLSATAAWQALGPEIATVSSAGVVTAVALGSATVRATSQDLSESVAVEVTAAALDGIAVSGGSSLARGRTVQLTATGTFSDATTRDLTATATWSTGDAGIATVTASGLVTAVAVGSAVISAGADGKSGGVTIEVRPAVLDSIAVTPATATVLVGATQPFAATGTWSDRSTRSVTSEVTWASNAREVATVGDSAENKGVASAIAAGTAEIRATLGAVSGAGRLVVESGADTTAPTIVSTMPAAGAFGVGIGTAVRAIFSEGIAPATLTDATFTLTGPGGVAVAGSVTWDAPTRVATFRPSTALTERVAFTATVAGGAGGVTDLAGNPLATAFTWTFTTGSPAGPAPVLLGAAGNYAILAESAISTVPTSRVTGDVGLSPAAASFITGFSLTADAGYSTSSQVTGRVYAADDAAPTLATLTTAVNDLETAYADAARRASPDALDLGGGEIGGRTLAPGLYRWTATATVGSDLTLAGGANDIWIFQIGADLRVSPFVKVILTGGAEAGNVFWQVGGVVDVGTTVQLQGNVLCQTDVTLRTGASLTGRLLAMSTVVLDANVVTSPGPGLTLTGLAITPGTGSLADGLTRQYTATATYSDGSSRPVTAEVDWASDEGGVAHISESGLLTAAAEGTTVIRATLGATVATVSVTVTPGALVALTVTPETSTILVGDSQPFLASGTYTDGSIGEENATWTSSDSAVADRPGGGSAGDFEGLAPGTVTITATVGTMTAMATLTVEPAP